MKAHATSDGIPLNEGHWLEIRSFGEWWARTTRFNDEWERATYAEDMLATLTHEEIEILYSRWKIETGE